MKVLVVSTDGKLRVTRPLWRAVADIADFEHVEVQGEAGLECFLKKQDLSGYDRVVVDSNLRRIGARYHCLKGVPGLVLFDHDICQTNVRTSEWYKTYPAVLRDIGSAKVIVSGKTLAEQLQREGIDACYLPKAYDCESICPLTLERDIRAAFVGRVKNKVYRKRRKFLNAAKKNGEIELLRADPGEAYNHLLHRIHCFVSADIGFDEYMIKNFEAMAAGCVLVAWRQPAQEQEALGLEEGKHLVLYGSMAELREKLAWLELHPDEARQIACAGRELVAARHRWKIRAGEILTLIQQDIQPAAQPRFWDRFRIIQVR